MGQYGLSEVRFMYIPAHAREPQPSDGAVDVEPSATLSWRPGREAASHQIYLGADPANLALAGTVEAASFQPDDLVFGHVYYWRVDEVNEAASPATWEGDLWSFTTQEYATIDDIEGYTDDIDAGQAVFQTWIDGWTNNTGSTTGYTDAPFAEKAIVHGGRQSMPYVSQPARLRSIPRSRGPGTGRRTGPATAPTRCGCISRVLRPTPPRRSTWPSRTTPATSQSLPILIPTR
jgi:hypothetical protein